MLQGLPRRKEEGGGQGTPEALLGSAPLLRELRLEESPTGPLSLLRLIPATLSPVDPICMNIA